MKPAIAKLLVAIGCAGLVGGGLYLYWMLGYYDPDDVPPTIVMTVGGALATAVGLAKLGRRVRGGFLVTFAAVACVIVISIGRKNRAALYSQWEHERQIKSVAEAVCDGTPNPSAAAPQGARRIMQVITRHDDRSYQRIKIPSTWDGLPAPRSVPELQLVACRAEDERPVHTCSYADRTGAAITITKAQRIDTITLRDARTADVLAVERFEGGEPSTTCDDSIVVRDTDSSRTVSGMSPDRDAETAFLRRFVFPAEN